MANVTNYAVVQEKRKDVHSAAQIAIYELPDPSAQIEGYDILGNFPTENLAYQRMTEIMDSNATDYTIHLNLYGLPIEIKTHGGRWVVSYVGNDLTPFPGYYIIHLHDFVVLRSRYPSVRLATNEELGRVGTYPGLRVHDSEIQNVQNLGLKSTPIFKQDATDADILNHDDNLQKELANTLNYLNIMNISDKFARIEMIKSSDPNLDDASAVAIDDELFRVYGPLRQEIERMRSMNTPEDEMFEYVFNYLKNQ